MLSISAIYWDPSPEIFILPIIHWPILWYGVFFALGFAIGYPILVGILTRFFELKLKKGAKKQAQFLADHLIGYVVIATLIGARLGHFIFYEKPSFYLNRPLEIFKIWEGGLASHGAAVGIFIAVCLFYYRYRQSLGGLSPLHLIDFLSVPASLAGGFIRLGNFFNQEILGTKTNVPWAVIFGHPADRSYPQPRHPVQLYEAFFYFILFIILWRLSYKNKYLLGDGKLAGLFFIFVFGFRFIIEFWKVEQSHLLSWHLTMGQILSLPMIFLGLILISLCLFRLK